MRNWKSGVALTALSFAVLSAAPVAVSAAEAEADAIEEVVVTAQRREQGAQKVGLALSVIGGSSLEEKNINIVNDVETALPNVEVDSQFGGGQPQFRIRGIGAREYSSNNASTVGIYVDEVAHPYTVTTQNALFDVSRIEVLRGPQGTLYGRNTTGGAINVVTNAPTHSFAAGASLEGGSYNRYKLEGYVSGPLNDKVRGRLAAFTEQGGGWQYHRDTAERLGDADRFGLRGRLAWDITDAVSADLSATWQRDKSDGLGFRLKTPYAVAGNPVPPYPADTAWRITGWQISPLLAAVAGVGTDAKPFRDNEGLDVSARINADLGWATLTSVTAYQQFERAEYNDWDGTRFHESDVYFYNDIDVLTQELRLASKEGGALEWLAGIYLAKESIEGGFYTDFRGYTDLIHTPYKQDVNAAGVFFHGTYALSDRFRLVGGLRYENEERELTSFGTLVGVPASASTKHKTDLSEVTGKFGLEFDLTDNALIYANVARGVKSGGFTTYNASSATPFRPEVLLAYEAGLKSEWFDRRLRLNASAFYYDYKDQQVQDYFVSFTAPVRPDAVVGKIANAAESHLYGAEIELAWQVTKGLQVTQYLGYKYGEYDKFDGINRAATDANRASGDPDRILGIIYADYSGVRLETPKYSYGGAISYNWDTDYFNWRAETNYSYRGERYSTAITSVIPDYWLANASVGFGPKEGNWRFTLWGRNITDQYYDETNNGFNSSSRRTVSPHQPRTVGARIDLSY